jgi:hypothetical protein
MRHHLRQQGHEAKVTARTHCTWSSAVNDWRKPTDCPLVKSRIRQLGADRTKCYLQVAHACAHKLCELPDRANTVFDITSASRKHIAARVQAVLYAAGSKITVCDYALFPPQRHHYTPSQMHPAGCHTPPDVSVHLQ